MKREGIAYGPVIGYTALLIAASGALGWVVTGSWYPLAILLVPVIGIAAYRLIGLYSDSIRRVTFMFNAIDNDDFTFRFHEDPSKVDNGMLNAALNRIKEILVRAKVRAEERERYYQLIMEYARTGLITINDAGSVYQANGEALRIFGLPRLTHIQQLELPAPEAYRVLTTIRPGEKHHVSCVTETGEMGLSLGCSEIVLEKRRLRVVVVSDINSELSEMQIESWSKLTRILTHEIMNSLAPITSLSDTLLHIDRTMNADVAHGLDTISATSRRLMAFVENFRRFTKIPAPQKAPFEVRELLEHAMTLIATEGIRIRLDVEPADTMIHADQMLVRTSGGEPAQECPRSGDTTGRLHRNHVAHRPAGKRGHRNKQQRWGDPRRSNRKYLYAFLHDQTRRIGHRPERLAPHHAAAQRLAAPDGQHGQPGDLHAPVRIDARNAPYSVPANFRVTESSGGQPPPKKQCPAGNGTPQERDSNTLPRQWHRDRPRIEECIGEGTVVPGLAVRDGEMPSQPQCIVVDHSDA